MEGVLRMVLPKSSSLVTAPSGAEVSTTCKRPFSFTQNIRCPDATGVELKGPFRRNCQRRLPSVALPQVNTPAALRVNTRPCSTTGLEVEGRNCPDRQSCLGDCPS